MIVFKSLKILLLIIMSFSFFLMIPELKADRVLFSTPLSMGMPEDANLFQGKLSKTADGIRFEPKKGIRSTVAVMPILPKMDYVLYSQLQFDITAKKELDLTVKLESSWPCHKDWVKKDLHVKKGTHTFYFYMHQAGYKTVLRNLVFKFNFSKSSAAVVTVKDIRLNAVDYSIKRLKKQIDDSLGQKLPEGFSDRAIKTAESERKKLRSKASKLFRVLKNRHSASSDNKKALSRLYRLRNRGEWAIQYAALKDINSAGIGYGWTGGVDKVLRDGPFPGFMGGTAKASMGRNETEGLQIALFATKDLKNVSVNVKEFTDVNGNVFPSDNIRFAPLGYITPTAPAYFSNYIGYLMPDPLLDYLKEFDVQANKFQPVWFDFHASRNQLPGIYKGAVEFLSEGAKLFEVPVLIKVHKFTLPDRMTFPAVISSGDYFSGYSTLMRLYESDGAVLEEFDRFLYSEDGDESKLSPEARRLWDISRDTLLLFRDHRISYQDIYRSTRNVIPAWRRQLINEYNDMYCLGYDNDGNVMKNFKKQFDGMRKEGVADRAYVYGNDEIRTSNKRAFQKMKHSYGSLKKAFPELKTMATALDSSFGEKTDTKEEVDIWVVPPGTYLGSRKAAERARKRGKQVWWYPCNWPYPPSANLLLESQATATRMIIGFMPWKYKVDGMLYYSTAKLDLQKDLKTLIGRWYFKGNVKVVKYGDKGYNSEYMMRTTSKSKKHYAQISRWTALPKNQDKPLTIECEIFPEKYTAGGRSTCEVELRLNYKNGKTDRHFLKVDPYKHEWQKFKQQVKIAAPLKNMLFAVRLNSPSAVVRVKGMDLFQEGVFNDLRFCAAKRLEGGPLLSKEYSYSMFRSNGDGTLIYPGPDKVLPSIRFKFLRDGLEDYEYLVMLKKAIEDVKAGKRQVSNKSKWLKQARDLLEVDDSICRGLSKYPRYGSPVLAYREEIANLLDKVK